MINTTIPVEFENYLQEKIANGLAPDMNEMVFAYIPNLDSDAEIDRNNGLPDESQWVHQQNIDQAGKIDDNALAYSVVVPNVTPSFTFNAIYIHDKNQENSCGVVIHKPDETKEDGMSITRTLVQEYSGAASIAGITVDASTWQLDYSDRLLGIDDDHRLSCLNSYGRAAFIEGFEPSPYPNQNKYKVTAGIAYIGGLRVVLEQDIINSHNTKPTTIYVDASRDGSALSKHINAVTVFTSNGSASDNITDYVDENGKQHYVEKLAEINANGTIADLRNDLIGALERSDNAATNDDIDNESTEDKHIKLEQFWRAINKKIDSLTEQIEKERVSVGEIIEISGVSTNPSILKGYGTWQSFGMGQVTVGVGSHKDTRGESKTWNDGQEFGEYRHVQTEAELAKHDHENDISVSIKDGGEHEHYVDVNNSSGGGEEKRAAMTSPENLNVNKSGIHSHEVTVDGGISDTGSSSAMNITQPSIAVYRWKRTA